MINEIYPTGGNTAATYNRDFVELYNRGTTNINIAGYSLQYESVTGAGPYAVCNITASDTVIEPGTYFLIATGAVGTAGIAIPTPNATCSPLLTLAGTGGKVALVSNTTQITVSCPVMGGTIVDFVGYGTTANCSETAPEPAPPNNQTSLQRTPAGTDTNNNFADFTAAAPTPQAAGGPTAAGATIGGRIVSTRGRSISYVTLMLTGGDLEEPIYSTTNTFGYYQFPEVATGQTYILQVFSRRYTFNPSSRVINLNENLSDADFVGTEGWLNNRLQ